MTAPDRSPETPDADLLDQTTPVAPDDEPGEAAPAGELPVEAPEADVLEQGRAVDADDDEFPRDADEDDPRGA